MDTPESPFVKPLLAKVNLKEKLLSITSKDHSRFLIYDQTHKVGYPKSFRFFQHPIEFIGLKLDPKNVISSLVIYVEDDGNLIAELN